MLLVYTHNITPRVEYIFNLFFHGLFFTEFRITDNENAYKNYTGAKFSYTHQPVVAGDVFWQADTLLFEDGIKNFMPEVKIENDDFFLFPQSHPLAQQPFDPFAAAFYLVSRYEEYLPYTPDKFNRFEANQSLMGKYNVLHRPLVNEWANSVVNILLKKFAAPTFFQKSYKKCITIDIDMAYAYKHRGWISIASLLKQLLKGNFKDTAKRIKVLLNFKPDPYDTYPFIRQIELETKNKLIYFVNIGAYSQYDKNISADSPALKKLLTQLSATNNIGAHPSYYANDNPHLFEKEITQLSSIIGKAVKQSKQHYLRLKLPDTYFYLLKNRIEEDYTMGYASMYGFRAGICVPFYWFNLKENCTTDLLLYPIAFMEGTFRDYLKMPAAQALKKMKELTDTVKKYEGTLSYIWHNTTVSNQWEGMQEWREAFCEIAEY
jgi:hypothetical protein